MRRRHVRRRVGQTPQKLCGLEHLMMISAGHPSRLSQRDQRQSPARAIGQFRLRSTPACQSDGSVHEEPADDRRRDSEKIPDDR